MRQPNRVQWIVLSLTAALLVFAWPPERAHGTSLAVTLAHWMIDPAGVLPSLPPPLPPGLGDNGDAVAARTRLKRNSSGNITVRR